jgi:digeranylgeranylglycerophospholipid reductase
MPCLPAASQPRWEPGPSRTVTARRNSAMGKTIGRNWHIKEKFITLSDAKLNAIIHSAKAIDMKDFSTISLIKEIIKRNPLLLADLAGLMASIG